MALPKVKYPKYTVDLKSNGQMVKYRPFTVREEKVLLTALQGQDLEQTVDALKDVVNACTFGEIDLDTVPSFEIEKLFLHIRSKSVEETIEQQFSHECSNGEKISKIKIDLTEIEAMVLDSETEEYKVFDTQIPKSGTKILIADDMGVTIRYPNISDTVVLTGDDEIEMIASLVKRCITSVFDEEEVVSCEDFEKGDIDDFYESLLTSQKLKLVNFISEMPRLRYSQKYKCKTCGLEEDIVYEGLQSFFS